MIVHCYMNMNCYMTLSVIVQLIVMQCMLVACVSFKMINLIDRKSLTLSL